MKTFKQIIESYYAVVDKNGIIQFKGSKSIAKKKLKDHPGGFIGNTVSKGIGDKWKTEDMSLAPKGKGREAAKKLYKEDDLNRLASLDGIEEVSPAQRRARKQAYLKKTMAKYGMAAKMGIPADQVNQRRNHPTRKKA